MPVPKTNLGSVPRIIRTPVVASWWKLLRCSFAIVVVLPSGGGSIGTESSVCGKTEPNTSPVT